VIGPRRSRQNEPARCHPQNPALAAVKPAGHHPSTSVPYQVDGQPRRVEQRTIRSLIPPATSAFTAMRARGTRFTTWRCWVWPPMTAFAPRTLETIKPRPRRRKCRIVVAINKIDKGRSPAERVQAGALQPAASSLKDWGRHGVVPA